MVYRVAFYHQTAYDCYHILLNEWMKERKRTTVKILGRRLIGMAKVQAVLASITILQAT